MVGIKGTGPKGQCSETPLPVVCFHVLQKYKLLFKKKCKYKKNPVNTKRLLKSFCVLLLHNVSIFGFILRHL